MQQGINALDGHGFSPPALERLAAVIGENDLLLGHGKGDGRLARGIPWALPLKLPFNDQPQQGKQTLHLVNDAADATIPIVIPLGPGVKGG
jgi:hypothetical protein